MSLTNTSPVRVVAGVARRGDCVLIGRRRHDDVLGGVWEFPGGKVEAGESPEQALIREFLEEFGAEIRVKNYIGARTHTYSDRIIELVGYEVELLTPVQYQNAHEGLAWVRLGELNSFALAPADEFLKDFLLKEGMT